MARKTERLSVKSIQGKKTAGYYPDGDGLYLQVSSTGTKSWLMRYTLKGKEREMGLGSLRQVSLAEARTKKKAARDLLNAGIDPLEARKQAEQERALAQARETTFQQCAESYIQAHRPSWKNAKHAEQWQNTLDTYCAFGETPVQHIDTTLVLKALEPIWNTKPETAGRLRGRIERVLDWAKVRGYRGGENPARWRGHLDKLLPSLKKRLRVKHHPALPFDEAAEFMRMLRTKQGVAAQALQLVVLTATRTSEVLNARWDEFDLDAELWTIPATRTKSHREHRVPLSSPAIALLRALSSARLSDYVFPGLRAREPLSNMALLTLLRRMGRTNITTHGFRSTFMDWASERTSYSREVCEMALAHIVKDATEAAYRRGDLFEKRRRLMADWARFCETPKTTAHVLPIRARKASR